MEFQVQLFKIAQFAFHELVKLIIELLLLDSNKIQYKVLLFASIVLMTLFSDQPIDSQFWEFEFTLMLFILFQIQLI